MGELTDSNQRTRPSVKTGSHEQHHAAFPDKTERNRTRYPNQKFFHFKERSMSKLLTQIVRWSAALLGGIALSACSKVVSFVEEVEIEGKTYQVERREYFDRELIQLRWTYVTLEHELYIKGLNLPRWRTDLTPMYVGLNAERQYVLVGLIRSSYVREKRGYPPSSYVGFKVSGDKWIEVPVPPEFDGRKPTFLMGVEPAKGEKAVVKKAEREFRNKVGQRGNAS